jgi:hypothetical protein
MKKPEIVGHKKCKYKIDLKVSNSFLKLSFVSKNGFVPRLMMFQTKHEIIVSSKPNLYVPSTINTSKRMRGTFSWADEEWAGLYIK